MINLGLTLWSLSLIGLPAFLVLSWWRPAFAPSHPFVRLGAVLVILVVLLLACQVAESLSLRYFFPVWSIWGSLGEMLIFFLATGLLARPVLRWWRIALASSSPAVRHGVVLTSLIVLALALAIQVAMKFSCGSIVIPHRVDSAAHDFLFQKVDRFDPHISFVPPEPINKAIQAIITYVFLSALVTGFFTKGVIPAIWILGVATRLLRLVFGLVADNRLRRAIRPLADGRVLRTCKRLRAGARA